MPGGLNGAAILQVLCTGMVLLGSDPYWQSAAIGPIILVSPLIGQLRRGSERARPSERACRKVVILWPKLSRQS